MSIVTPNDFKRGMCIRYRNQLVTILTYARGRTGMRRPYVNTKMRVIETGQVLEDTFSADDKFESVFLDQRPSTYMYKTGDKLVFMDNETYDQPELPAELFEEIEDLMKENSEVTLVMADGRYIDAVLPDFIELEVTEAAPHVRGDTATSDFKRITLETGATIMVPPHIKVGDKLQIDTRTREYVKRIT